MALRESCRKSRRNHFTTKVTVVECCLPLEAALMVTVYVPAGVPFGPCRVVVTILNVEFAEPLPGVTLAGLNEQVEAAGKPEHDKETAVLQLPPWAVVVTV